jgi:hypothetical protein
MYMYDINCLPVFRACMCVRVRARVNCKCVYVSAGVCVCVSQSLFSLPSFHPWQMILGWIGEIIDVEKLLKRVTNGGSVT